MRTKKPKPKRGDRVEWKGKQGVVTQRRDRAVTVLIEQPEGEHRVVLDVSEIK
jgi:ribosomal protein L21E